VVVKEIGEQSNAKYKRRITEEIAEGKHKIKIKKTVNKEKH
jgi:hypothetical protein